MEDVKVPERVLDIIESQVKWGLSESWYSPEKEIKELENIISINRNKIEAIRKEMEERDAAKNELKSFLLKYRPNALDNL